MPATATASAAHWDAEPANAGPAPGADVETTRAALYGGLVGDMIGELEHCMTVARQDLVSATDQGVDLAHRISVAAGYVGLAAGCAATVAGVAVLL